MADSWISTAADEVRAGDRIRMANGEELQVSRIEKAFFGMPNMLAFIEDSDVRWFKQPVQTDTVIDVQRAD